MKNEFGFGIDEIDDFVFFTTACETSLIVYVFKKALTLTPLDSDDSISDEDESDDHDHGVLPIACAV